VKVREVVKRVLDAAVWALIMGGEFLLIYRLTGVAEQMAPIVPQGELIITSLAAVFIAFEVAIRLLKGTIFSYALDGARAIASVAILAYTTNFGVVDMVMPLEGVTLRLSINFQPILAAFMLLGIVSLAKSIMEAVGFASKKLEGEV